MKKFQTSIICLFLLFVCLCANSQRALRDSVLVKSDIFTIMYSEKLEQPLWIRYTVLCPTGKASRAGMDFYTNDTVHTSNNEDYADNVYDKGHMAPAADFNCNTQILIKTFSYINCALQNQYLNRGAWRLLEAHERELALTGDVSVLITLYFGKNRLATGATVPVSFKKQISHKGKTECYFFLNERPISSNYLDYKCK
jgi:DNA/RNA endonuclease G (NUC1)